MTLTFKEFKELDATFLSRILWGSGIYTSILALVTLTAFSTNIPTSTFSQSCDNFEEVYLNPFQDAITLSWTDPFGNETAVYLCTEVETERAPLWVSGVGLGIFLVYLFFAAEKGNDAKFLIEVSKIRGEDQLAKHLEWMTGFKTLQVACVEICGLILLFRSTNATDVIVNSSATLFLGEVDDVVIALLINHYKKKTKMVRTIEFGGMEMEFDPSEIPEKVTKNLLPEPGADERKNSAL
jgi:hypothetical protein